ncbi:MAG TPA: hypothetical protein GX733_08325 [Tissierellia bacterium]|jgi:rubrerythrin|nr:hypothetical protein [Tissierellia bacterium]
MEKKWTAKELFKGIVEFENRIGQLYDNIAEDVKEQFGVFFENMAKDEYRHAKIYEALGQRVEEEGLVIPEEDQVYLSTLFDNSSLKDPKILEDAKKIKNKWQILDLAEKVEREAIGYVRELAELFPDLAEDQVKVLLQEEKKHLQMVLDRKRDAQTQFLGL